MKNIKKIVAVLLSMTAIASTSVMAADEANFKSGTASLELKETVLSGEQLTVVIVPTTATEITSENIYYINQGAFGKEFEDILAEMKVKDGFGDAKDYEVRIGGVVEGDKYVVKTFNFKVEAPVVIDYGNVDGLGVVDGTDVTMAARAVVKQITLTADQEKRANVDNSNNVIDGTDVTKIARYVVKQITDFGIK